MNITTTVTTPQPGRSHITASLPHADLETYRTPVMKRLREKTTVKGFRKGATPDDILVKHVGELAILEEMAQEAIAAAYVQILQDNKIQAIGRPHITITKIAPNNPLEFSIETDVLPDIHLPDYKKIASKALKEKKVPEVAEADMQQALDHIRRIRTHNELVAKHDGTTDTEAPKLSDITDEQLLDLDDTFVKTLGDFANVADFTEKLRQNLIAENEQRASEQTRLAIIEEIIAQSNLAIPQSLIDFELSKMKSQLEYDLSMSGMQLDNYLEHIKKTESELLESWKPDAEKRAKMQLILNHIAVTEKIEPDAAKVEHELEHLKKQYGEAKDFNEDRARAYIEQVMLNQAVFAWLENA